MPIQDQPGQRKKMSQSFSRFVDAYNQIDAFMRQQIGADEYLGFTDVVRQFSERRPRFDGAKDLHLYAKFRNLLVHGQRLTEPLFEPSAEVLSRIEFIRDGLISPQTAFSKFGRKVVVVSPSTTLLAVLNLVRESDLSQFPIYENGSFQGLLTENGMTRWLAHHVSNNGSILELDDHSVAEVHALQEERLAAKLVGRDTPVDIVESLFAEHLFLKAVIITHSGKSTEQPLGIATEWDVARAD